MFAPHVALTRSQTVATLRVLLIAMPVAVAAAVTAVFEIGTEVPAVCLAAGVVATLYGVRLIRMAWRLHASDAAMPFLSGRCRAAGLLGVGFLVTATTSVVDAVALELGATRESVAQLTAAGLAGAVAAFVPGLMLLPGAPSSSVARLRRILDGVSIGICLLFTSWVLIIAPEGRIDSLDFWLAILTSCTVAFAVVSALRAGAKRRSAMGCAGGAALAIVALDGLAFCLSNSWMVGWPTVFCLLLCAAPALAWAGARRAGEVEEAPPPDGSTTFAAHPLLAVPAAVAIAVALHRLVTGIPFDRPSVLLGVVGISILAVRETLAALDVARYARRVVEQEAQFRSLVAGSTDVIMVLDGELRVRWQSPAAARQFGLSDQDVVGRQFASMVHPADAIFVAERLADMHSRVRPNAERPALIEARLRDGFGQWRETESSLIDQRDVAQVAGIVIHIRDIGERKEMERTVHRLAYADQLTGLANRRQMLLSIVALRSMPRARGCLILLELDGFNAVNDVRGYDTGDAVLVEVARRLRENCTEGDLPARLSGAEFAIVTEAGSVQAYAQANRLLMRLTEPMELPGATVHLTATVGIADIAGGQGSDDVLRRADLALRRAKQLGRGRVEWYDENVEQALMRRMTLEQELPGALQRGEFDLMYQPILDLVAGRPLGVEALLRWRHPRLGTLLPADVIPVAEDLGLIGGIGSWVLNQASRQLSVWLSEGRDLTMSVNVSPRQLSSELTEVVANGLDQHHLPPDHLVLEIAEGGLATHPSPAVDRLTELRSLGVRTALDEFGTGAESLTHLRRLPVDMVKIGRSFFAETPDHPGQSVPIIDVMVGLGRRLGVDVVAHGLESPAHLDVVRSAGCRLGQGHLFARPQPAERIEAYLDGFGAR